MPPTRRTSEITRQYAGAHQPFGFRTTHEYGFCFQRKQSPYAFHKRPCPCIKTAVWDDFSQTPENQTFKAFWKTFVSYCLSDIWKGEKYKPYILKYKALISKYVPCIFCDKPCVFSAVGKRSLSNPCFCAFRTCVFAHTQFCFRSLHLQRRSMTHTAYTGA